MKSKVNKIPEDWEVVKLGDVILDIGDGGTPSTKIKEYFSGKIPWVNIEDIKRDIYDTRRHLSESGLKNSSAKLWPEGTIIFSFGASIGKVGIARVKLCTKQGIAGIVPNPSKIDSEFLYYVLVRESEKIKKIGQSMGSTIREVRPSKLVKLIIFGLPPLPEQKAIAQILSTVDKAIQKVDEIITKTERLKKGLMQKLLTKGIGHKEFKDTEIGRIPKEWEVVKLGDAVEINKESIDPVKEAPNETFIYIDIDSIESGTGKIKNPKKILGRNAPSRARHVIHENDVIMSTVRPYLKAFALIPKEYNNQICSTGFAVLTCKNSILPYFLLNVLFSDVVITQCNRMMVGGQYPALNQSHVSCIKIPIPPLSEQQKIAEILLTIDKKLELERKRKEKLERIKKGLMNDLLTGKMRVKI
jgi:type I restriction enzyme S subunit